LAVHTHQLNQRLFVAAFPASVGDHVRWAGSVQRLLEIQNMGVHFSANDGPPNNQWWPFVQFSVLTDGADAARVTHLSFKRDNCKEGVKAKEMADAAYVAEANAVAEEKAAKVAAAKAASAAAAAAAAAEAVEAAAMAAQAAAAAAKAAEAEAEGKVAARKRGRARGPGDPKPLPQPPQPPPQQQKPATQRRK